jgi:hypothetical protein
VFRIPFHGDFLLRELFIDSRTLKGFHKSESCDFRALRGICFVAIRGVRCSTIFVAAMAIGRAFVSGVGGAFVRAKIAARLSFAGAVLVSALHKGSLENLSYGDTDAA